MDDESSPILWYVIVAARFFDLKLLQCKDDLSVDGLTLSFSKTYVVSLPSEAGLFQKGNMKQQFRSVKISYKGKDEVIRKFM